MAATKVIYGFHAVLAAIEHHPENVLNVYAQVKEESARLKNLLAKAQNHDIHIETVSATKLDKLTQTSHHQGIAAKIRSNQTIDEKGIYRFLETTDKKPLLLLLEGIQDPHNLGACIRSAEALGVDFIVIPKAQSATMTPTVSKIACGADQTLPVVEITNMVRFIEQIQQLGVWVVGTSGSATQPLAKASLTRPTALVMGAEGKGLKRLTLEKCDEVAKIPLTGTVASLNVSVATGICLYEVLRQREKSEIPLR
jgi:23S rRNA (guanosine2251-2'-O)-methyltransferase